MFDETVGELLETHVMCAQYHYINNRSWKQTSDNIRQVHWHLTISARQAKQTLLLKNFEFQTNKQ